MNLEFVVDLNFMLEALSAISLVYLIIEVLAPLVNNRIKNSKARDAFISSVFNGHIIFAHVEKYQGILLAYNTITNDFMAQGNDKKELMERLEIRYPDKYIQVKYDG